MQAEFPRELEAKYTLAKHEDVQALIDTPKLPDGFSVGDSRVVAVADVYVDTRDIRLLRHGYTLRIRRQAGKHRLTLKSLENLHGGHIQDRLEIEEPVAADSPGRLIPDQQDWHEAIRRVVEAIAGKKPKLRPICHIRQTRHKQWIHDRASDSPVVELSIDQVAVSEDDVVESVITGEVKDEEESNWTTPVGNHGSVQFLEIELELVDLNEEAKFRTLLQWLESCVELSPIHTSKLVSGLRAIAARPLSAEGDGSIEAYNAGLGIQPQMQMADACRLIWRQQMTEMVLNESGVRADQDIEYVHDMRVATRRARAAHVLFGEDLKQKQVRRHVKFFKKTARSLGDVRDLDVALRKLKEYRKRLPKEERGALKPAAKHWQRERRKRLSDLCRWLDTDAYAEEIIKLDKFCRTPGPETEQQAATAGEPPPLVQVRHVLPGRILARFEAVRRYEVVFAQTDQVPLETLHALRIDCKYLRYVLEFSQDLLGPAGEALIMQLKTLQNMLGDLNDADVARTMLLDLPKAIRNEGISAYIREQETISDSIRSHIPDSFVTFVTLENRLLLMTALAHL